jgi:hypothetical protein
VKQVVALLVGAAGVFCILQASGQPIQHYFSVNGAWLLVGMLLVSLGDDLRECARRFDMWAWDIHDLAKRGLLPRLRS